MDRALNTALQYQDSGEYFYGLAADMEDKDELQEKIDNTWALSATNFHHALVLGSKKAPLSLFKCFRQGVGVKKDDDIAKLMYGAALKLTPQDCNKIKTENKPIIPKSMQPRIDILVKLVKSTHAHISNKEVDKELLIDQLIKFDYTIKLPFDKKLGSFFLDFKESTTTTHDELGGASASSYYHDTPYEDNSHNDHQQDIVGRGASFDCCILM